jgi:carbon-monoxide dehydrogenase medium subunit
VKAPAFDFVKAQSIHEVLELMKLHGDDAQLIAGGQTLLATLNMRLSEPQLLIDITQLTELKGISQQGTVLRIGALVTHTEIENSELIQQYAPLLSAAAPHIAHRAIRNLGTWGGSIAYGDPAAEWPACSLALDAIMIVQGPKGERRIPAAEFFVDLYTTALNDDELLIATEIPLAPQGQVFSFQELARRHGDYAVAGLAAVAQRNGNSLNDPRLVFFSVANIPVLAKQTQALINQKPLSSEVLVQAVKMVRSEIETSADITNSAETKTHLVGVLFERAIKQMSA